MRFFKVPQALLFIGISLLACYFTFLLCDAFLSYFPRSAQARAHIFQWEVLEVKEKYPIKASYSFEVGGKVLKNSFVFSKPWSWNEASAVALVKEKAKESWTVWYNPKNPSLAGLERNFPYNILFRALICYGVLLYFIILNKKFLISVNS